MAGEVENRPSAGSEAQKSTVRIHALLEVALRGWRGLLQLVFFALCLRFETVELRQGHPYGTASWVLVTIGITQGYLYSRAAIFSFTLATTFLYGLKQTVLSGINPPPTLFAAIYIGATLRQVARLVHPKPIQQPAPNSAKKLSLALDILASIVLVSLIAWLCRNHAAANLPSRIWSQADFGFGDKAYPLSSAFLWLQGIFYCRLLLGAPIPNSWPSIVLAATSATILVFFTAQWFFAIPDPYVSPLLLYFSPYEDIHSLGSVLAGCLMFFLCQALSPTSTSRAFSLGLSVVLCGLVALSFSRATWLSVALSIWILAYFSSSRRLVVGISAALVIFIAALNIAPPITKNFYISRLISLVKIESLRAKDPARMEIYDRSLRMIKSRPVMGHGVGSFYLGSVAYESQTDTQSLGPNFAHNMFLQIAAELGIPAAAIVAAIIGAGLNSTFRRWRNQDRHKCDANIYLGLGLSLAAYVTTQLTANSWNVYSSHQFFFWFLIACIFASKSNSAELEHSESINR